MSDPATAMLKAALISVVCLSIILSAVTMFVIGFVVITTSVKGGESQLLVNRAKNKSLVLKMIMAWRGFRVERERSLHHPASKIIPVNNDSMKRSTKI